MTFVIEKNIHMPPALYPPRRNGFSKYPFKDMVVGDSILTPKAGPVTAHKLAKKMGWEFQVRKISDTTVRIWRVA